MASIHDIKEILDTHIGVPDLGRCALRITPSSGTPTLTDLHFLDHQGEQVPFDPGTAELGDFTLTEEWQTIAELWEDATSGEWATMEAKGVVGIVPSAVGGTGTVEMRYGDQVEDTPIQTLAVGDTLRVGRLPISFQLLNALLEGTGLTVEGVQTRGVAAGASDKGTPAFVIRSDAGGALDDNGDWTLLQVDSNGLLRVVATASDLDIRDLSSGQDSVLTHPYVDPLATDGQMPAGAALNAATAADAIAAPGAGKQLVILGMSLHQEAAVGCGVILSYDDSGETDIGVEFPAPPNNSGLGPIPFPRPIVLPENKALRARLSTVGDSQVVNANFFYFVRDV